LEHNQWIIQLTTLCETNKIHNVHYKKHSTNMVGHCSEPNSNTFHLANMVGLLSEPNTFIQQN
jgi:hypothetical protein